MCGLAGIVAFRGQKISPRAIERITGAVSHRGPDGAGFWFSDDRTVSFGHRRLSILDLSSAGSQPMTTADGRFVMIYNGEIYNFLEIARELEQLGDRLRSASDTEVILLAFERWGSDMLKRFNGMWSLAIYDTVARELFLSRDRYGVKPMYYYADQECLVFASEVQAIERLIPDRVTPNAEFMSGLTRFDVSQYAVENTYLNEVKALLPGFNLRVAHNRLETEQWYRLEPVGVERGFTAQVEQFRELFVDACRIRLRSDVPVATCLSGGVDSGSIVSVLGREKASEAPRFPPFSHRSFTAAFPETELDETADARLVAASANMTFDAQVVEMPTPDELETAMSFCDGPMPALAFYPIWKLYRHVRESGITVTLDGQGGDEMLGGYYLGVPALRGAWQTGNMLWMRDVAATYGGLNPHAPEWMRNDWQRFKRETVSRVDQAVKRPVKKALAMISLYDKSRLRAQAPELPPRWAGGVHARERNSLALALWRQFFVSPLPFLLYQYDRCSMASGVECRMPFMDYRLVEYVFSLPLSSKIGHGYTKRILREAMKGILPEKIRTNRTKTGFNAPFKQWFSGPLRTWLLDQSSSESFLQNSFFDGRKVRQALANPAASSERESWGHVHVAWWLAQSGTRAQQRTELFAG
jgi:asparagine synthase (glutamine-hydrolysing)